MSSCRCSSGGRRRSRPSRPRSRRTSSFCSSPSATARRRSPAAADLHRVGVVGAGRAGRRGCRTARRACWSRASPARASRATSRPATHPARSVASPFDGPSAPRTTARREALSAARAALVRGVRRAAPPHSGRGRRDSSRAPTPRSGRRSGSRRTSRCGSSCARRCSRPRRSAHLLEMLGELLVGEIELLRLERKIDDDVRGSLFQNQREFYLQEQLKAIHRELGRRTATTSPSSRRRSRTKALPAVGRRRARCASCESCGACRRCRPNPRSRATSSTGSSRCRGRSAPTTCSTSRTRARCSTRTTTASRR